jgi:acyl-CoA thioesterase I
MILFICLFVLSGPLSAVTIVCLGDSLTAGRGVDEDQAFPAVVRRLALAEGLDWTVVNAGVSGDTSAGGLRRVAWLVKSKPDWALVALGGNDGLRGQPTTAMSDNLIKIVQQFRAAHVRVALAGMRLSTNYGEDYRTAFAAVFPTVATKESVPLLPFLLTDVGGVAKLNQADGIHPTVAGQAIIARTVYTFLKPLVEADKQADSQKHEVSSAEQKAEQKSEQKAVEPQR